MSSRAVIGRELRVQSRARWMPWWRVLAGAIASLQLAIILPWLVSGGGFAPGQMLLGMLGWMAWALCAVVGIVQTADSLSREQREGTLPLLFLTELRGLDVILGKFVATSLPSFYCLLAVFPAMAVALPAGGVTGGEFWRTQLALVDTLFLAVSCGLLASARHQSQSDALRGALRSFLIWSVVPLIALLVPRLPVFSPAAAMVFAADAFCRTEPWKYWGAIGSVAAGAVLQLVFAGRQLGRNVVEADQPIRNETRAIHGDDSRLWPSPSLHATVSSAKDLRDAPAAWLAGRERGIGALVGTGILLPSLGILFSRVFSNPATTTHLGMTMALQLSLPYAGGLLLVAGSGRFFGEARRSGGFELLLCTPLSTQALVHEAWFRIRRFLFFGGVVSMAVFALGAARFLAGFGIWECLVEGVQVALRVYTSWVVCRLALWFSAAHHRTGAAMSAPLVLAMVVPTIATYVIGSIAGLFLPRVFYSTPPFWFWLPWLVPSALEAAYLAWLDRWARRRLTENLREAVAGDGPGPWPWRWKRKEKLPGGARERT